MVAAELGFTAVLSAALLSFDFREDREQSLRTVVTVTDRCPSVGMSPPTRDDVVFVREPFTPRGGNVEGWPKTFRWKREASLRVLSNKVFGGAGPSPTNAIINKRTRKTTLRYAHPCRAFFATGTRSVTLT